MSFSIQFLKAEEDNQNCAGRIFHGNWESFNSFTGQFSREPYEAQWKEAVRIALIEQRPSALSKASKFRMMAREGYGCTLLFLLSLRVIQKARLHG
jgi:hypothetical protein